MRRPAVLLLLGALVGCTADSGEPEPEPEVAGALVKSPAASDTE